MKSEILSQEKNVVSVKVEYDSGEVDAEVGKTLRELSNKANIKGFRRGHVPRKTLELMIGKNSIYRETVERLAGRALENVISEYELTLVVEPKLELDDLAEGRPLGMKFTFEVRPEVELPDISALSAEKTIYAVDEEDVDECLRQVLESNAHLEPLQDDRPAEESDIVETQYSSYQIQNGGKLKSLEKNKKGTLYLSTIRRDIAEAIIGRKPAEEFSFDIKLEDDYPDKRMAGGTVRYELEILNFMKRVVPDVNDETIEEISHGKFHSVGEIRADLRAQLEKDAAASSDASLYDSAVKVLSEATEIDVPETMIDRQYLAMRRERDSQVREALKLSLDDYLTGNNLSVEEYDGNIRKRAGELVRNTLVLEALAERDDISFTNDDINEEIIRTANSIRVNPQELADMLGTNKQEFTNLVKRVRTKNTIKHLATLVQVTEKAAEKHEHGRGEDEEHTEESTENEA